MAIRAGEWFLRLSEEREKGKVKTRTLKTEGAAPPSCPAAKGLPPAHCQAVPQRGLVRKSCSFITFYFYVLSLEYPQALSSSISSDCNQRRHGQDFSEHAH